MIRVDVVVENIPADFFKRLDRGLRSFVDRMSGLAQKVAVDRAPKDTGQLQTGIHIIRDFRSPIFTGGIETGLPHAVVMEEGRKPGTQPPLEPIIAWVKRHKATFSIGGGQAGDRRARSVAFAIARKIKRKGIPSNPRFDKRGFFKKAQKAVELRFGQQMDVLGAEIQAAWEPGG